MKKILMTFLMLCIAVVMQGQILNPVQFSSQLKELKGDEAEILFTATIDNGWHVYSTDLGDDGPISATFSVVKMEGTEAVGKLQARGQEIKKYDPMFGMELRFFEQAVTFVQKIRFTQADYDIDCYLEYGACNDQSCLPPTQVELKKSGRRAPSGLTPRSTSGRLQGKNPSPNGEGNLKGKHTLKIKALDDHIIFDQWMLDFKKDRKFYVIPVG
jgi:thiol:disulfide interchange protein DsbD